MMKRLDDLRAAKARGQRYGPRYNFGATYYDARDEAIRRGDRVVGTEHMLLALLADPASPAARAIGCDLESARTALDAMDAVALAAIGVNPGITAGPITVRPQGKLRLTPTAKAIFTGIPSVSKDRRDGLGIVLNAVLDLRRPDPAAELLAALGADTQAISARFAELDKDVQS
jgi:Clp amino terminal domain, pathogenicity island component